MINSLGSQMVSGDIVKMALTDKLHMKGLQDKIKDQVVDKSFTEHLTGALGNASDAVKNSEQLTESYMVSPDSVDVHDVTIAMAKANMAVTLTKSVTDNVIRAYKEIINLR